MTCRDLDSLVFPYLDGELEDAERAEVEAHLPACPACAARVSSEAAFQGALHRSTRVRRAPAPDALRELLRAGIRKEHRRIQALSWARWGSAALVAAAASVTYLELRPGHREQVLEEAALRFQRRLPMEVTQAAPEKVEAWFDDKLAYRVAVPRFPGARLQGARLSNVREHDAALLVYDLSAEGGAPRRMGLFVLDDSDRELPVPSWPAVSVHPARGYNVATWRMGELVYELVSTLEPAELRQMLESAPPLSPAGASQLASKPAPAFTPLDVQPVSLHP